MANVPGGGDFFCGKEITGADIMLLFPLQAATNRGGLTKDKYPKVHAWLDKMQGLESYEAAGKKIEEATGEKFQVFG